MDIRERILTGSDELFCRFGIKRITMDDIAKQLGVSKKTLYQHFKDKNELVYVQVKSMLEKEKLTMDANAAKAGNAVEAIFLVVTHLKEMLSKVNPMMFYDLQKYHSKVWLLFKDFRYNYMKDCVIKNLHAGIEEGNFRKEINCEIIALMRLDQVDMIFNQIVFPPSKYLMTDVMTEITEHYLYGLCTTKGHDLIKNYKQLTQEKER